MKERGIGKTLKIPVEVYSRVVGYFRPVDQWNKGKQEEFRDRKPYKLPGGNDVGTSDKAVEKKD